MSDWPSSGVAEIEDLKVIRGRINTAGSGSILQGSGFTIARNSTGNLTVTFSTAFSAVPAVVATVENGTADYIVQLWAAPTVSTARFQVTQSNVVQDAIFDFIAIGPR